MRRPASGVVLLVLGADAPSYAHVQTLRVFEGFALILASRLLGADAPSCMISTLRVFEGLGVGALLGADAPSCMISTLRVFENSLNLASGGAFVAAIDRESYSWPIPLAVFSVAVGAGAGSGCRYRRCGEFRIWDRGATGFAWPADPAVEVCQAMVPDPPGGECGGDDPDQAGECGEDWAIAAMKADPIRRRVDGMRVPERVMELAIGDEGEGGEERGRAHAPQDRAEPGWQHEWKDGRHDRHEQRNDGSTDGGVSIAGCERDVRKPKTRNKLVDEAKMSTAARKPSG